MSKRISILHFLSNYIIVLLPIYTLRDGTYRNILWKL